jgi:RND family efflux transporter MFP subunit
VAGSVIASFENSGQRAAVLQAQGAYEGAQAALAKISGSTAQNSGLSSAQAAQAAQSAATSARSALQSAYATLDDSVRTKADAQFSNPQSINPQLNLTVPDGQIVIDVQSQRVGLDTAIEVVAGLGTGPDSAIDADIATAISKAQTVRAFLDDLVEAANKAVASPNVSASTIAAYQASVGAARAAVLASMSSLTSAKSTYSSAVSAAAVAENSAGTGIDNDIASAQAQVKSALGTLNAAQSNLEKTIIRAPISGTIVSLGITRGGYVAAFTPVAQISNPGALEIETYVTSDDAKTIVVGGKAVIDGSTDGVITSIAPALDPTIGKIQVKIGITGDRTTVTDGDTVTVTLARSTGNGKTTGKNTIAIPIAAAKITPAGPVVFTVEAGTLVPHAVTFGAIVGGQVTITNGLSADMTIVTDARGLTEGQKVIVDTD